jgi:hypothetical protein
VAALWLVSLRRGLIIMADQTAEVARLMKMGEAIVDELHRQGFDEVLADIRFDLVALTRVVIKAADGDVVPIRSNRRSTDR